MIKSSHGRHLKSPERLNDSENNLIAKCSNKNRTIQENLQVFRHCTRCSAYFYNRFCDLSEKIIKLLNERSDNYWFCPSCTKPALHVVFVEKGIEEKWNYWKKNKKIEEDNTSIFSSLETVMKNTEEETFLSETNLIN